MGFFDVFAWIVFVTMVGTVIGLVAFAGMWPGRVARARNHPQAEAIVIGSWLTLFLGFILWPAVAIWAHIGPSGGAAREALGEDVEGRLARLEERLAALELAPPREE